MTTMLRDAILEPDSVYASRVLPAIRAGHRAAVRLAECRVPAGTGVVVLARIRAFPNRFERETALKVT